MEENQNNPSSERCQSSRNASNENRTRTLTGKILPDELLEDYQCNASSLRIRIPTTEKGKQEVVNTYPVQNPSTIGLRDTQLSNTILEMKRLSLKSHTSEGASSSRSNVQQAANMYPVQIPAAENYHPQLTNIGLRDSQISNPTLEIERLSLISHLLEESSGGSSSSRSNSNNKHVPYNLFPNPEQSNFLRNRQDGFGVPIRGADESHNSHSFDLPNYPSSSTNLFNNNMNSFHNQIGYENVFQRDCCFACSLKRQCANHINNDLNLLSELSSDQIVEFAKCPEGSKYLKGVITDHGLLVAKHIFRAVLSSNIVDVMNNEYGKHMFQKLVESGDSQDMEKLVMKLANQQDALFWASIDTHGSHCVQKLIKTARRSNSLISNVMVALAPRMLMLMKHSTGRRVIQACLENLNPGHHGVILEVAKQHCLELALHSNGCVSLNFCIENMREDHRGELAEIIIEHSMCLSQDCYGNFVVQKVLSQRNPTVNMRIFEKLQEFFVELSKQKSGSHVVENCAISGGIEYVIKDFLRSDALDSVAGNQFGNFVIQRLIELTRGTDLHYLYMCLEEALLPHLPKLQLHPYGNFIYNLIMKGKSSAKNFGTNRARRDNFSERPF